MKEELYDRMKMAALTKEMSVHRLIVDNWDENVDIRVHVKESLEHQIKTNAFYKTSATTEMKMWKFVLFHVPSDLKF
jgi:hypothetical protein